MWLTRLLLSLGKVQGVPATCCYVTRARVKFDDRAQLNNSDTAGHWWHKCCKDAKNNLCHVFYIFRKPAKKGTWSEEETEQLRALYEEYKNSEGGLFLKSKYVTSDFCPLSSCLHRRTLPWKVVWRSLIVWNKTSWKSAKLSTAFTKPYRIAFSCLLLRSVM